MASGRRRIGECLVEKKIITQEQLEQANELRQKNNTHIGEEIIKLGFAKEEDVYKALSEQLNVAFIDISSYEPDPECIKLISWNEAVRLQAIPIYKIGDTLTVAMLDPLNVEVIDELEHKSKLSINPIFTTPSGIEKVIMKHFSKDEKESQDEIVHGKTAKEKTPDEQGKSDEKAIPKLIEEAGQAPVIELVQKILSNAISRLASDIHLEPQEHGFFCRYRVDGILQDSIALDQELQPAIISRVKIMAEIDISERRLPQDGRCKVNINDKNVDLRVATFPTIYGEHVAIRILDKSTGILTLEELGVEGDYLNKVKKLISRPHGIILVTGPTGSGKSTTLYSMLNTIDTVKNNVITLEDPVEYSLEGVHQAQVNIKAGLTFALGLRSIVRLDPDIIMIGEIRDKETAEIAIHAALTGHLVFSTLHTNDAPGACARLINIGVEPYLLSSSLTAVLAQRLVRKLCPKCKESYQPNENELSRIGLSETEAKKKIIFYREKGCKECQNSGFKGRVGVFELFVPTDKLKEMIVQKTSARELLKEAKASGMKTLLEDSFSKVIAGVTSLSEVIRVTEEV